MSKFRLDEVDHQILDMLIDNTRVPFTDIAKKLLISAGTVHVRVKKMEDAGIIMGSSLVLDYDKLGYSFIAYVGVFLNNTSQTKFVLERINEIPFVTVASVTTGKFNIFCKIRAKDTKHAKDVIFMIDDIDGVYRTETMISLEESINDMIIYLVGVDDSSSDTEDEDLDVDEDDISSSDEESDEDDVGYDEDEGIDIQPDSDSTEDEEDAEDLDEDVSSEDAEEDSGEKSLFWKDPDESSYEDLDIDNDFDDSYTADESVEEDEDIAEDEDLTDEDSEDTSDSDGDVAFDDISADDYFADSLGSAEIRRNITSIPNNVKNTADTSNNRCFDEKVADTLTGGVAKVFDLCKTRIRKIRDQNEDKM